MDGNVDEVAVWNSDQSANIATIYNSGTPNDITSLSPSAYWKLGEQARYNGTDWLIPNSLSSNYSNFSFDFDGVDDYIDIPIGASVAGEAEVSISVWINPNTISGNNDRIFDEVTSTVTHTRLGLERDGVTITMKWRDAANDPTGTAGTISTGNVLTVGVWTHIVGVYDSSSNEQKIYIDGVLNVTGTTTIDALGTSTSAGTWIGSDYGSINAINAIISNVAVFDSALTSGNVTTIYNSGKPADLTSLSPISWWRLGEDASFSTNWNVPDQIGSNDGTSANMTLADLVGDAPGITGSGTSDNMTIEDREGNAPNSDTNALSYNMDAADVDTDVPS